MSEGSIPRKIRVAFVVGEYPPDERKRREDAALAYASAEVEVGIVSVKATPYYVGCAGLAGAGGARVRRGLSRGGAAGL